MVDLTHYRLLAGLLEYPEAGYPQTVTEIYKFVDGKYPVAAAALERYIELLPADNLLTMQELFTRSFDVQAIATLDIGYVLFGDDYKRGELLANLNSEHHKANNDCGTELADYLPNIMRLMSVLQDDELVRDLAYAIVAPALLEMIGEFDTDRIAIKNKSYEKHYKTLIEMPAVQTDEAVTLYKFALKSLYEVLKQDFKLIKAMPLQRTNDFLGSIVQENDIEESANAQYDGGTT
jgi:nitrate reductase assembly molybdenum cofactor insertion protein NarJ